MFEDLKKVANGRWGLVALAFVAFPGGRRLLRSALKETIRAGVLLTEKSRDMFAELREEAGDVMAEVRSERSEPHAKQETHARHSSKT